MPAVEVSLGSRSYPIFIGNGLLGEPEAWRASLPAGRKVVLSNEVVAPLYLRKLEAALGEQGVEAVVLPDGEQTKTVSTWAGVIDRLVELRAGRDICLVALGGGVIGDICGFAAATWMRGVPFVQVPTSLLAQVDSSVGGKTGVNHAGGKNLIGAFHQPAAVIADTDTLDTLPDREFRAGLAEVVKYGAIRDPGFFEWLENNAARILSRDPAALAAVIEKSVRNKAAVVAEDELEAGTRAILNFGHTFAHALETVSKYSRFVHGEAVAIGMVLAARLSESRGLCAGGTAERISGLLARFSLSAALPTEYPAETLLDAMALDKKVLAGKRRLVLLEGLGRAVIDSGSSRAELLDCIREGRNAAQE